MQKGDFTPTGDSRGSNRLHTKTVAEMALDKQQARAMSAQADKDRFTT
jgi:hypothetical protein